MLIASKQVLANKKACRTPSSNKWMIGGRELSSCIYLEISGNKCTNFMKE
jgi:hypothetical protein